jgi:glycosyltransferase involved in cell wall biosynthesis
MADWSFKKNIASKLVVDWWEVWGRTWFSYSKLLGPIGYILETIVINRISKNSRLVAISKKSINEINIISPDSHNARLIHNGIDLENLRSISSKKRIDYDLSYIGRLKNHKNVDMLLQAIKYVEVHYDVKLTAVIVGDGPEFESLVSLSKELSIGERINFTGAVLDNMEAYSYVASSKFFVNPSTKEGGGSITLLEAFALGLPAVGFDCKDGIDKDLIGDGDRGILVKTVSVEALGECLHDLLNCPAKIKKMSEAGVTYSKDFDWDSIASEYVDLFKEIIQDEKH